MNLDAIKKRLGEMQSNNSNNNSGDRKNIFWRPSVGKETIRVVPNKFNKDFPFTEMMFYYGIGPKPMSSPSNWGEKDPIIEFTKQLRQSNDSENWKLAKKLDPKTRIFAPSLNIYKSKKTKNYLRSQINTIFKRSQKYDQIILAYEPLWSIGTGLTPELSEIDDICKFLTKILEKYTFKKINILYGGSVNLSNISEILKLQFVNGVLVGSASTKSSFINYFK